MSMLSQAVSQTGNNEIEQNEAVLNTVANYFDELAMFVNASNVTVNATVSQIIVIIITILLSGNPRH